MNREEYLKAIAEKISSYPEHFRREILKSFMIQYDALKEDGYSEEEILQQLGTPSEAYIEIRRTYGEPMDNIISAKTKENLKNGFMDLARSGAGLVSAAAGFISGTLQEKERAVREKAVQEHFMNASCFPVSLFSPCRTLRIAAGKKNVGVFLMSGSVLSGCLDTGKDKLPLLPDQEGDCVTLKPKKGETCLCIRVPSSVKTVEITTGGEIGICDLAVSSLTASSAGRPQFYAHTKAEVLTAESSSGNITVQNSSFSSIRISSRSGSVDLFDSRGTFYGKTSSGRIRATHHTSDRFLAETKSGAVTVSLSSATVSLTTSSGKIRIFNTETPEILAASSRSGSIYCSLLSNAYTAHVRCRESSFINNTSLPVRMLAPDVFLAGEGKAAVDLSAASGSITLQ